MPASLKHTNSTSAGQHLSTQSSHMEITMDIALDAACTAVQLQPLGVRK